MASLSARRWDLCGGAKFPPKGPRGAFQIAAILFVQPTIKRYRSKNFAAPALMAAAAQTALHGFYIDTIKAMHEAGDLIQPIKSPAIDTHHVKANLADLCAGRMDARAITLFKSVGPAHPNLSAATLTHDGVVARRFAKADRHAGEFTAYRLSIETCSLERAPRNSSEGCRLW